MFDNVLIKYLERVRYLRLKKIVLNVKIFVINATKCKQSNIFTSKQNTQSLKRIYGITLLRIGRMFH
jgi:hypothetical protein